MGRKRDVMESKHLTRYLALYLTEMNSARGCLRRKR
jgi:hypothetical protein